MGASILAATVGIHGSVRKDDNSIEDIWINLLSVFNINEKAYYLNDTLKAYSVYRVVGSNRCLGNNPGYGGGGRKKAIDGVLVFTKVDAENKIVAGTISLMISTDYCDTLKTTDGRFDIRYD